MGVRRVVVRALVLCVMGGTFVAWSGVASAKLVHPFVASFGSFSNVQGVAADSSGNVYVYDGEAGKVYKFDASGAPVNFIATATNSISSGSASGAEGEIAVDNSSGPAKGDIYVAHAGGSINIYSAEGGKLGELKEEAGHPWGEACGVAVDSSGNVYVGLYSSHVNKYVPSANPVKNTDFASSAAGLSEVCNVAADSTGNVFADQWNVGPVTRYEPSQFGSLSAAGSVLDSKGSTVAVDPANQEVYVDEKNQIVQFGAHGEPFENPVTTFAAEGSGAISGSIGIAVSPSNHDVYASDGKGKISVFGPAEEVPAVTTEQASGITHTEASLSGSVNPEGVAVTACQFEYGTTTSYGQTMPCPTNPGSGGKPVEEAVSVSGLEYGTEYHYRLLAKTAKGEYSGGDRTFITAIVWPETITGLPDGRLYELVSPANKHGNEVYPRLPGYVTADGDAVMYTGTGALVETSANGIYKTPFVSQRTSHGWVTRGTIPLPAAGQKSVEEKVENESIPWLEVASADLSHLLFETNGDVAYVGPPDKRNDTNLYLEGPDPSVEPEWVGRPQNGAPGGGGAVIAGNSPDLKTIYFFAGGGSLLPGTPSSLYEYRDGALSDVGVLPAGETGHGQATAAASGAELPAAAGFDNQVSADGSRIFFTRENESGKRELYVHVTAPDGSQSSMLVSQSQLPGHSGEPAPHGPRAMPSTAPKASYGVADDEGGYQASRPSYVFASPDGSHAFFQSTDRLTAAAPEDSSPKTYDFDLETGVLEYVPGLTGSIVTVGEDGSWAVFENTAGTPFELERWVAGPGGGSVTPIAQLPSVENNPCREVLCVGPAYSSSDGKVLVFNTESPIAGFNDGGSHYMLGSGEGGYGTGPLTFYGLFPNSEVFRYDTESSALSCLSCPPRGEKPSGDAILSPLNYIGNNGYGGSLPAVTSSGRSVSADGGRVFFETWAELVPQDTNGVSDVYEWEKGKIYLISSGHSPKPSFLVGSSESGDDVFFVTAEGIAPGDVAGEYDVYDARVPRPGDNPPPEAIPCTGAVCQGPPSVPQLLGQPASEAFNGEGNATEVSSSGQVSPKSLTRAQKLARALRACRREKNVRKRRRCETSAQHRYGAKAARARQVRAGHHNGRGK